MKKIFDFAIQKSNDEGVDFFIVVFEQLLDQFDNLLYVFWTLKSNCSILGFLLKENYQLSKECKLSIKYQLYVSCSAFRY